MNCDHNLPSSTKKIISRIYYIIKPLIPRRIQIFLRRYFIRGRLPEVAAIWPIDRNAAKEPAGWKGWPGGKRFGLVLTHDVESEKGLTRCRQLAEIEMEIGFRSSFNFLLKKYQVPDGLRHFLEKNGFEVGIHGLYHDGKKFNSREIFMKRAKVINRYLEEWGAVGFRAPSMHCNLDWISELNIEYDASTFDTDPFEPKTCGVRMIFPFFVPKKNGNGWFIELPYTLAQDFTLFVLIKERNIDIWKKKLDWIVQQGGMALINTHPDYMNFAREKCKLDEYPARLYEDFLHYVKEQYGNEYWNVLPRQVARSWPSLTSSSAASVTKPNIAITELT